jgi:hypothetical protein
MTTRRTWSWALVVLVGVLSPAGLSSAVIISDTFSNNSINTTQWRKWKFGGVNLAETNARLQTTANGATGSASFAFLETKTWGADWQQDFIVRVNYNLNLATPTGSTKAAVGFAFAFDGIYQTANFFGLTAGVQRDKFGLWLVYYRYEDGVLVGTGKASIPDSQGQIRVVWRKATDRLVITAAGRTLAVLGLHASLGAQYGTDPLVINVGAITLQGNIAFTGANAWLDSFVYSGVTRPR